MKKSIKTKLKKLSKKLQFLSEGEKELPLPSPTEVKQISEEEVQEIKRIKLPEGTFGEIRIKEDLAAQIRTVNETYPLITLTLNNKQIVLASANIRYEPTINQLIYLLIEPKVSESLLKIIQQTIAELHDRLEVDFSELKNEKEIYSYVDNAINEAWQLLGIKLSPKEAIISKYYIFRELIGLGKIEALMRDPNIEDISCDGVNLPIYVFHRNPLYGELPTNVKFKTKEELDSFVMKLAQKCGRTVSVASPLMDGSLPDGSRVQVTYGTDIARRGSNFTIRKFFRTPLTPIDLINFGTFNPLMMAYLWLAIEKERSILIAGSTATGKTTVLNALSLFIEPNLKIVSIEDTAELQLPHINWMPQITRAGFGPSNYGEVSMFDLLKAALRQRPDYLIVGEVRGREANVLFQAMSTGHPGMSTLHADTVEAIIDRLTTRPIDLPLSLLENLDIIIFLVKTKKEHRLIRRVGQIIEIEGYNPEKNKLLQNVVFEWVPAKDIFVAKESYILHQIATHAGMTEKEIHEELLRRVKILEWMQKNKITKFNEVSQIINMYYTNPSELAKLMEE